MKELVSGGCRKQNGGSNGRCHSSVGDLLSVDVGVVHFTPLVKAQIQQPFKLVEKVVRNVFQFRRKHCHKGIEKLFPEACRPEMTQEVMQRADVDPALRPTELTIPQIRALADAYAHLCTLEPDLQSYEFREELRLKHLSRQQGTPAATLADTASGVQSSPPHC